MNPRALLFGAAAAITVPSMLLVGVGVIVGAAAGSTGAAAGAAAAVCTYAYPDADRIAATMAQLTADPVQPSQWDRYAPLIGVDPGSVPFDQSTPEQRAGLLPVAVQQLLYTNAPAAITTPPVIWWLGVVPDDSDLTWQNAPVPGWAGTLDTYLAALVNDYATTQPATSTAAAPSTELGPGIHWGEQTMTREQIAQVAYQAGFSGDALVAMVGIAWRESGGHPQLYVNRPSTGDWSYGLWGLNVGPAMKFWPQFQSWGFSSPDELRTPLGNARAAFAMYQQMGQRPWGPYKGRPWTYSTDQVAARAAVDNAARQGLLGQSWPGTGDPAATPFPAGDGGWSDHQCIPPTVTACRQPADTAAILATIRHIESGDDYTLHTPPTTDSDPGAVPSGAYHILNASWAGYSGYADAYLAPPDVQDQFATDQVTQILAAFGDDPAWVPVAWHVGIAGARNVQDGTWSSAYVPDPITDPRSIGDYQTRWLEHYTTIALPAAGGSVTECAQGGAAAVAWGETQLGAPYAASSRYRFGDVPWPGGTRMGDRGKPYTFPAGTIVYDCSGFVIRAWREAGVDLSALYGLYGSQQFPRSPLQEIDRGAVLPGDLAVYSVDPKSGVGHIVMIHHVDPDGAVHVIEATPSKGVHIGLINWARVTSIKRPALPAG